MKREHYSLHYVFSVHRGRAVCLGSKMEGWLLAWADTDPSVATYELSARAFEYEHRGKTKTTTVPLVAHDGQKQVTYWDVADTRGPHSTRPFEVKQGHAAIEGCGYRLFTSDFFEGHLLEWKNRMQAHRWLQGAYGVDLRSVEKGVRLSTAREPKSFQALSDELRCCVARVQVAALRLWKQGKVHLPLDRTLLADPAFVVGARHGHSR